MNNQKIVIATRNSKKEKELSQLLSELPVELLSLRDSPTVAEIAETGATFKENAILKAVGYSIALGLPVIADDSGLEVAALGGRPGVRSSRYAGATPTSEKLCRKLLSELTDVPMEARAARFVCTIAYATDGEVEFTVTGTCDGRIGLEMRGGHGFGYDPVFVPRGHSQTFAEMPPDRKNRLSHRGKAIRLLREKLMR